MNKEAILQRIGESIHAYKISFQMEKSNVFVINFKPIPFMDSICFAWALPHIPHLCPTIILSGPNLVRIAKFLLSDIYRTYRTSCYRIS